MTTETVPTTTVQDRYKAALAAARKRGVRIRQNVAKCCRSCASPFAKTPGFDREATPYGWTFGGQGNAVQWIGGLPFHRDEVRAAGDDGWSMRYQRAMKKARVERIYFSHGNGGGQILADAFAEQGFQVADFDPADPDRMTVTVLIEFPEED